MKKLVTAVCALAAAAAIADVPSKNVVGFIEQDVDADSMSANVGVCFNVVGDPTAPFTVTDEAFGTKLQAWDQFYLFDADNWDLTYYTFKGTGKGWDVTYADSEKAPETINDPSAVFLAPGQGATYIPTAKVTWEVTVNY